MGTHKAWRAYSTKHPTPHKDTKCLLKADPTVTSLHNPRHRVHIGIRNDVQIESCIILINTHTTNLMSTETLVTDYLKPPTLLIKLTLF